MTLPALLAWIVAVPLDETVGDDWSRRLEERHAGFLKALLYIQLPALSLASFFFAYYLSDWTFLGSAIDAARARTDTWHLILTTGGMALFYAIAGINVAHELVHRNSRLSVLVGRWLLSFSLDTGFSLEHVYGHHLNIGTKRDPATAPRGQGFWAFYVRMLYLGNRNAWRIEKRFLKKQGLAVWSFRNRFLTGQLMSMLWIALFAVAAGWVGVLAFTVIALWSKLYLELTNYIEHYGLVRVEGTRVAARHSWNSSRRLSNWLLFNLPRHSDHHIKPGKNYWELDTGTDAPQLPHGYFSMAIIALIPRLYVWWMRDLLAGWDRNYASAGERGLIAAESAPAGVTAAMPTAANSDSISEMRSTNRVGE